ncbi:MAG: hypothetical protein O9333_10800 [Beijerinckiaceae bacterium]|jgi:hypothetical protein|nr:hypothetical protein [Beijerinckiaceae bacterium]
MTEVTVILSKEAIPRNFNRETDYWVAVDLLDTGTIADLRQTGIPITVLSSSPGDDDGILEVIRMAMLHNADWSRITVLR